MKAALPLLKTTSSKFSGVSSCVALVAVATVAAATEEGLAEEDKIRVLETKIRALQTKDRVQETKIRAQETKIRAMEQERRQENEKIALLTLEAKHHKLEKTKLKAAVDAMKTLSPETKRQVAVELSAAKSLADTGAPPAKPESISSSKRKLLGKASVTSDFDWTQCKSEVCCPIPFPPTHTLCRAISLPAVCVLTLDGRRCCSA